MQMIPKYLIFSTLSSVSRCSQYMLCYFLLAATSSPYQYSNRALIQLLASHKMLLYSYFQYAKSEEIFTERSLLFRVWYMTPLFFTFRMRFYSGFILSEVACIMAGLGAYPVECNSKPGQGPTALQHL